LNERGYQEIVLHTEDVGALYTRSKQFASYVSPREVVQYRSMSEWGFFLYMATKLYRHSWLAELGAIAFLGFRWKSGRPFSFLDILALVILVLPIVIALGALIGRSRRRYERLVDAACWARWEEVLRLLPRLPRGVSASERAFRKAAALAGLGRVDEALEVVKPLASNGEIPEWLYWGRLSSVYRAAHDREQALACMENAASLAPDNATILVDLALALLRDKRDIARAAEIVRRVKTQALSDIVMHFVQATEGILALEKGNCHEARELLEQARASLSKLTTAAAGPFLDRLHAYLCLAEAGVGNYASARQHLDQATPRFKALGEKDLLARCEKELGD